MRTTLRVHAMAGWQGIPWEPQERCIYCDFTFFTFGPEPGPRRREIKREHRLSCPPEVARTGALDTGHPVASEIDSLAPQQDTGGKA